LGASSAAWVTNTRGQDRTSDLQHVGLTSHPVDHRSLSTRWPGRFAGCDRDFIRPASQARRCRCREQIGQLVARRSRIPKVGSSILTHRARLVALWRLASGSRAGAASLFGRRASRAPFACSCSRGRYFELWALLPAPPSSMTSRRSSNGALPREEISTVFCRRAGRAAWRFRGRSTGRSQRRAFDASVSQQSA
jgi:hypothetical protein